jgi:hypothetical protein
MYDPEARIFFRYIWPGNRLVEFNVELDSRLGRVVIYISKGKEERSSSAIILDKTTCSSISAVKAGASQIIINHNESLPRP